MHCGWAVSLIVLREGGTEPRAGDEQKGICFLYSLKVVCMGCTCYRRCVHHGIPVEVRGQLSEVGSLLLLWRF